MMELVNQRLELIDPLVHRSEPDSMTNRGTPAITDVTQALATPTTPEGILRQIYPKSLILLKNSIIADHIMLAVLTFQHRHVQILNDSPACLQLTPIMAIPDELVGITAPTMLAFPVDGSLLALPWLAFLSPEFRRHLGFHYLGDYLSNGLLGHVLHMALDLLQDRFPFFFSPLSLAKLYTHRAEDSL
jgi:hypothetical protein